VVEVQPRSRDHLDVWLTRVQLDIYQMALTFVDNGTTSIRAIAKALDKSPSTVSRAIVKLVAFGLLIAVKSLGRYAAMLILRVPTDGTLGRYRKAAKAKMQAWKMAAERRVSRLSFNVAPRGIMEEGLLTTSTSSYRRNIEFTPDDLREAGII